MATLKEPFALDRSLNTTEVTPRNIADVLAEGLSHITGRTASEVEYDNTDSGLTSDDVQGAIDELSERPTLPSVDIQTAVDEFETYNGGLLSECKVALTPNQDLHGYENPWVGGASKNLLLTTVSNIKAINSGSWSGNVCTVDGVEFEVLMDDADNVLGIKVTRKTASSGNVIFNVTDGSGLLGLSGKSLIINGAGLDSSGDMYLQFYLYDGTNVISPPMGGDSAVFTANPNSNSKVRIVIRTVANPNGVIFRPMVRLSSESDPAFAPYTNICPISGHTQVEVEDVGKNRYDKSTLTLGKYVASDGTLVSSGASDTTDFIPINGTEDVMLSYSYNSLNSGNERYIAFYDAQKNFTDYKTYAPTGADGYKSVKFNSTSNDARYVRFTLDKGAYDVQVELGSTATAYEPYNGYQVTVNLGGTYYSGTLDVVSGVFTPDTASVDLGTLTWTYEALWGVGSDFYAVISGIKPTSSYDEITTAITEQYKAVSRNTMYNNTGSSMAVMTNGAVKIRDNRYSDEASFTSAVSGVKLVYPLATPTPIQLIPTPVKANVGENHLSTPLEGQEIVESKYKQAFTFDDVIAYIQSLL